MGILSRNLFKSVSNFRHVSNTFSFYIPKRRHIFKTAAAEENRYKNDRVLVRRFRCSGLDESRYFSDLSIKNIDLISSRISEDLAASFNNPYFCGTVTSYFSSLSSENDLSPIQNLNFPSFSTYWVLGSCGGVVCLDNNREGALFWNPSTNESKLLPPSELGRPDPATEPPFDTVTNSSGFGYDSKSQDYKYIRWATFHFRSKEEDDIDYEDDYYTVVELYSLKTDSWKDIPSPSGVGDFELKACVNGDFYWFNCGCRSGENREIMKFGFASEEFSFLHLPRTGKSVGLSSDFTYTYMLFDFRGSLCVIVYPRTMGLANEKSFELWVWNGGWWMKEFDDCFVEGADSPLGFSKNGRLLFLVGIERQLLVYDICTKELKQLDIYCNPNHQLDIIPYVESTVRLNGERERIRKICMPNY